MHRDNAAEAAFIDTASIDLPPAIVPNPDSMDIVDAGVPDATIGCSNIIVNGLIDADEDFTDGVDLDMNVINIPVANPAIATSYVLNWGALPVTVTETATPFATGNGWVILAASDGPQADDISPQRHGPERYRDLGLRHPQQPHV